MVEPTFNGKAMQLHAFFYNLCVCTGLKERRESVVIGGKAKAEMLSKEQDGLKWGVGAGIATGHEVEKDNIWLGNLIEQEVGVVHGGSGGLESAEIDELGEYKDVVLEMSFYGIGLDLLELFEGGAFGEEREWVRR